MRENLSLGTHMRVLLVIAAGLLMLTRPAKADYILQNVINNGDVSFNQELAINNTGAIAGYFGDGAVVPRVTPELSSLALVGLGAVLVALGYKRRRS
jgi:hypothetical protein